MTTSKTLGLMAGVLAFAAAAVAQNGNDSALQKIKVPSLAEAAIPYVPTRHDTVRDLLWLADVGTNDVVYDLGSGDGRVIIAAVRDFGARKAVGIEIRPELVHESRESAVSAGVADRVEFVNGDLFTNELRNASVVVLYLGQTPNLDLRAHLVRSLKPGARIVSHQFGMGEWPPDKTLEVRTDFLGMYGEFANPFAGNPDVPDFSSHKGRPNHDVLSVWLIPAPVAGIWRGKIVVGSEKLELRITLHQRLSGVTGSFVMEGPTTLRGSVQADLWGDHLRGWCVSTNQEEYLRQIWFDGHAKGDTLSGGLYVSLDQGTRQLQWTGHRDQADVTGTWEWAGRTNSSLRLKVEKRGGHLTAGYVDKTLKTIYEPHGDEPIPVTDIYDFGGGFYFTLLLGRVGLTRRAGPEDGWLIGEAVMNDNAPNGTIAFHPYPDVFDFIRDSPLKAAAEAAKAENRTPMRAGRYEWQPSRVLP